MRNVNFDTRLMVRISSEDLARLQRYADSKRIGAATAIRMFMLEALEQVEAKANEKR